MGWGIETSFRELKYLIGLIDFHTKKHLKTQKKMKNTGKL